MPAFYIAPEASIRYVFVSPTGARAVLNDPSDPDFVGYLDGEEAISGIDSPEIRDSYADLADNDGGVAGTNFYSRRPIVMNGKVFPTSATDRNTKLGKLMAATDARYADGTLYWTPSGGEEVFVKFRRQLPFRAKGGFNKEFQIGLVCADPRIYTVRSTTVYTETNGNSGASRDYRRFTYNSGSSYAAASRALYLAPGTYTARMSVRADYSAPGLYLWTDPTVGGGNIENPAPNTWTTVHRTFTKTTDAATPHSIVLYTSNLPGVVSVETGDLRVDAVSYGGYPMEANAPFASNWAPASGWSSSWQTASPPDDGPLNVGNAPSPPRQRLLGPFSGIYASSTPQVGIYPTPAYSGSDYVIIDHRNRTVVKNNSSSDYASVEPVYTRWGGISPGLGPGSAPYIKAYAGATTATRLETSFRGTWL